MRARTPLALAAAAACALVLPAHAAPAAQLTDVTGDANLVNGQAVGLPVPGQATSPASVGAADVVSVRMATVFKKIGRVKVAKGFTVTLQLADAPTNGVLYSVHAQVPASCDGTNTDLSLAYLEYGATRSNYAYCQDPSDATGANETDLLIDVHADTAKRTVTWTLDKLPKSGVKVTAVTANTSVFVLGVFDEAEGTGTFTYGK